MAKRERILGYATVRVLQAIRRGSRYGFDIIEATALPSGTVYPTLGRMEKRGLLRARWEDRAVADEEGRPRRRYYELTEPGDGALTDAVRRFGEIGDAMERESSLAGGLPS
ncbi:MAG: helix-turn-helix transcriptional regulator [Gemmatimonadetes bacterium]|nr:helix-turn-helix transcriptional regulator [Gemmatimonadota bacterium]